MTRKAMQVIPTNYSDIPDDGAIDRAVEASDQLVYLGLQRSENANLLAVQLQYDGPISIGTLEDGIRFYQRRAVEDCLELGKRLLMLKELVGFGGFQERVKLLGLEYRMAAKFMSATLKFSKVNSNSLLKSAGSQSKLLELVLLDDDEIEMIDRGETVRGLNLDSIETMSVSELKKALRNANETADAKDAVIQEKSRQLIQKAEELAKLQNARRDAQLSPNYVPGEDELIQVEATAQAIVARITSEMCSGILLLQEATQHQLSRTMQLTVAQALGRIITAAYELADDTGIAPEMQLERALHDPARKDAEDFQAWVDEQKDAAPVGDQEGDEEWLRTRKGLPPFMVDEAQNEG